MKVQVVLPAGKFGFIAELGSDVSRRVYDGAVINIEENQFSKNWMKRLDEPKDNNHQAQQKGR